ncbi:cleavage stimulation factor subunit 77 [Dendrobium catenatum]|uniref:cleavage stimulation factor subunit 77 n=1 Tax=Dendrobium catenatum TaxID=906689 RepID=UPI00109FE4B2|nr:cleavage stimulation factor subunit 77 [Dendrobium catenatum]
MSEDSKLKGGDVADTDIYNVEAAEILANEALLLPLYEAVPIYEQLLSTFPTSAKFWKQYVEAYMAINNDEATKQIFSRCLLNCLQISLWRCYIRFIRKVNDKKGSEGLEETRKAFDFMLSYVGSDISAGPVWMEYITFLKSMPVVTAQEESQRMISMRKIYQKAIVTPTHHIEQLWKDYENFENSINRALAKGLLSEYQPKYNSARAVYRERKKYIDEIDWNMLAVPPKGSFKEEQQCIAWKRLLAFENSYVYVFNYVIYFMSMLSYALSYTTVPKYQKCTDQKVTDTEATCKGLDRPVQQNPDQGGADQVEARGKILAPLVGLLRLFKENQPSQPKGRLNAHIGGKANTEVDSGFLLDAYGDILITRLPFFDVGFDRDDTIEDYLNRIIPTLVEMIDYQFSDYEWTINGHPGHLHLRLPSQQRRSSCMMFMYHYPDIWYDYATWLSKNTSLDSAAKVFQRALKALPDSAPLKYAYAELEESRGAIQPAKKIYESLIDNNASVTSLAHIQFIKFLRRTEGIEVARKYFLDAQKLSNCTYHVFVAYAMMAFCLDKDVKLAHNVFEAGLKKFMNEPGYILEYADFLCRLNDDRNVRALFERALSLLPPENSEEVWKQFAKFEQTYGDLASILKVEQRRKEALSGAGEEDSSTLESTLHDVVSRYNFMDLWPCSSKELDHLARQEWLARTIDKKADKSFLLNGTNALAKVSMGQVSKVYSQSAKISYPDTSRMVIYDPRQTNELPTFSNSIDSGNYKRADDILKSVSPALATFITNLPAVEGPYPDVDVVLSILLQYSTPAGTTGKTYSNHQAVSFAVPSTSDLSGSSKTRLNPNGSSRRYPREGHSGIRKDIDRQEDDEVTTVQSRPLPRDMFRIRQIQKSRGPTASQTGSAASAGSAFSGDQSLSTD